MTRLAAPRHIYLMWLIYCTTLLCLVPNGVAEGCYDPHHSAMPHIHGVENLLHRAVVFSPKLCGKRLL